MNQIYLRYIASWYLSSWQYCPHWFCLSAKDSYKFLLLIIPQIWGRASVSFHLGKNRPLNFKNLSANKNQNIKWQENFWGNMRAECDVPVPGIFHFFGGIGTGIGTNWYRKKSRNRYRSNLVPIKSLGTGIGKIWYREKVSEPVSEKFDTGTDFRCQNLGILKIYNGYRYRLGAGTENFSFFWWYRNRYQKNLVPEKSLGTCIWKIWYKY